MYLNARVNMLCANMCYNKEIFVLIMFIDTVLIQELVMKFTITFHMYKS